jgi:CxxC motif-containing protein (DUF1111 family)
MLRLATSFIALAVIGVSSTGPREVGRDLFNRVWTPDQGLGPWFNARSCAACHSDVGREPSLADDLFVWVSATSPDPTGGPVFRRFHLRTNGSIAAHQPPRRASRRRALPLAGIGLLERAVLGRSAHQIGRFGWKARHATLDDVVAAALVNEMGLSSPVFPDDGSGGNAARGIEVSRAELEALVQYVRTIPPPPSASRQEKREGQDLFAAVGCATCHVPRVRLAGATPAFAMAYTDLQLHDLGPALADVAEGRASAAQFKTPPLWGLRNRPAVYLHDGRASSLHDAIMAHGGEAAEVRSRYERLSSHKRMRLLAFLTAL